MENLPDIKTHLSSKELFDAFKVQLARDFEQANFPSDFIPSLESNYNLILEQIAKELQRNEGRSGFSVMSLLYRVDISERQLKKYLTEHTNENHAHVIAELIIKRVLQKVVTKKYYKTNGDS